MGKLRRRRIATMVAAGLVVAGCGGGSSSRDAGAEAGATPATTTATTTARGQSRDACELIRSEEIAAIVGEPVIARPESTPANQTTCMYESANGRRPWFGITITWSGGREEWEAMQAGTLLAADIVNKELADKDVDVDSIVRPGLVAGLGDAATFSDLMPLAILEGDILVTMFMTFLPDPELHFVPLGRKALDRLQNRRPDG